MTARIRRTSQDTKCEHKQSKMVEKKCMDERKKDRDQPATKVVIRRLPPSLSPEIFLEQVSPLPTYDYFYYRKADMSLGQNAFTRAYINFPSTEDIFVFKDKFDGYVFVDKKGNEFPAVVEFAPFQKVPKKKMRKADTKKGTIDQDTEFQKFVENIKNPEAEPTVPIESYLEELESKKKELKANHGVPKMTTPLIEFIKRKREEKKANLQRQREDRKKREQERKKARDEDKRRRKEKEKEKREKEKQKDKDLLKKEEQPIKLLKNPDREQEMKREKDECDLVRGGKDEPEKPIKEREKLRFSKENREKLSKVDRQGQDRLKPGREGRFADRSKYPKDDRPNDKSENKFKSNKDDRSGDKNKNRDDKNDRQKSNREKYNRDDRSKCYQGINSNNSCREDKKSRHEKQAKHERQDKFDRADRQDKFDRTERQDKFDRTDRQDKFDRADRQDKFDRTDRQDKFDRTDRPDKFDRTDRPDKFDRTERQDKFDRTERQDKFDRTERQDKFDRTERQDKFDRTERQDKFERAEKQDKFERAEKQDKFERAEKQDKFERAEKQDKFERAEKQDKFERAEKQEQFDRHEKQDRLDKVEKQERLDRQERSDRSSEKQDSDDLEKCNDKKNANKVDKSEKTKVEVCHSLSSTSETAKELNLGTVGTGGDVEQGKANMGSQSAGDVSCHEPGKSEPKMVSYSEKPERPESRKKKKDRPERALYDPRKALERRQQSESARLQHHEKGVCNQDKGGNYPEGKAGSQEKILPERRDRNGSQDKGKCEADKERVECNSKGSAEKIGYTKGGFGNDKLAGSKGSAEKTTLSSIAASMEAGGCCHEKRSLSPEVSSSAGEDNRCQEGD